MKQRLMEIYFSEGGDLTQSETLVAAAAACDLNAEQVRALLASRQDVDTVEREAQSAKEGGIEGVPYFILGGMLALSGAQPPQYLGAAIERAAQEQAKRVAAE
jgi:predicted DsbA family dithiol-disulfide isomerase